MPKQPLFFEQLLLSNCNPNDVTFHYLVNGFSKNASSTILNRHNESEMQGLMLLEVFGWMMSDGWDPISAAYNAIIGCLCLHGMLAAALKLSDKMLKKGFPPDSVTFTALLSGICLVGKSKEWKSIVSCNLDELELNIAIKYSKLFELYLNNGVSVEASMILHSLLKDRKSRDQEANGLRI